MSHLDIVHMLSAYVDVIHILSEHMRIICTLSAVVFDMFLPYRQCWCHPYIISSNLYISYHVQLSFCTLSAQTHIVCDPHVVCICIHHLLVISNTPRIPYYPQLSFQTLSMSSVYCLQMHRLCPSDIYCCYLHMYMSSTYYLGICVLYTHYLQWSLIYSVLYSACCLHMYTSFTCHL